MNAYLLFQEIPVELSAEILGYIRENERDVYKTGLISLAAQKKLRPVFVQKKSLKDQIAWMSESLKLRTTDAIGEHLLQVWFLKAKPDMLVKFLDEVGIEHDGEGSVDDLPEALEKEKVEKAVDALLEDESPEVVSLYLYVFQLQIPEGWPEIADLLEKDERLAFKKAE